jgi:hypothetical protein
LESPDEVDVLAYAKLFGEPVSQRRAPDDHRRSGNPREHALRRDEPLIRAEIE